MALIKITVSNITMGAKASIFCCTYCNSRVPTEDDEFLGIKAEMRQKKSKENIPMPFQIYLRRGHSFSETESMLHFLENPQIDYLRTNNKVMQRSAILDIKEIPEIPVPNKDVFSSLPSKEKRSISLTSRREILRELYPLFVPRQKKSIGNS